MIVAGGGILGSSVALHLAEAGAGKVILLERAPALGTQTTHAGAGFVGYWAGELEAELASYGMSFYERLQTEDGTDLGVRHVGLIFPALSEAGVEMLHQEEERERSFAPSIRFLDADDVCRLSPLVARSAIWGGLFQPDARKVPTRAVMRAMQRRLATAGVEVRTGVEAIRARTYKGRVAGVETGDGFISAGVFVNAAGARSRQLGLRNDLDIAAVPLLESRVITEPVPEAAIEQPMLLFFERDLFYVRTEEGGLLYGAIEESLGPHSHVPLADPPDSAKLPAEAVESHERLAGRLTDVLPVLARTKVRERASGLPTWTPDGRHILGAAPGLEGYFVVTGCNEAGVTHGPGLARLAADLVVKGRVDADISPYAVDRFPSMSDDELKQAAAAQYLARHPQEPGKAPTPFGIKFE